MKQISDSFLKEYSYDFLSSIDIGIHIASLRAYFETCNPDPTGTIIAFDVGSNAGSFIKALQSYGFSSHCHCFEPHPVLYNHLKSSYNDISVNNCCVSDIDGEQTIYIPDISVGISSLINRPVFQSLGQEIFELKTKSIKLDTYCSDFNIQNIDFLKIDVEGAEKMVFDGASEMLKSNKITCGQFEIGPTLTEAGTSEQEVIQLLNSFGYETSHISANDMFFILKGKRK